jgi:hypothetical protein
MSCSYGRELLHDLTTLLIARHESFYRRETEVTMRAILLFVMC